MPIILSCSFQRNGRSPAYGHHRRAVEICQVHIAILLTWKFLYKKTVSCIYCNDCGAALPLKTHICQVAVPDCTGFGILSISQCFISSFISRPMYNIFPL